MKILSVIKGLAGLALGAVISVQASADVLKIAVSANFHSALKELVTPFEKQTGDKVAISVGSTGALYNQISHGAPFDLFLAADKRRPQMLVDAGKALDKPVTYAYGRLAYWKPGAGKVAYQTIKAEKGRIAIANPRTAPYGLAAQQVLEHMGLLDTKKHQLVQGNNIAQTWQFVKTGNVPSGFVALSQLRADNVTGDYLVLKEDLYDRIEQQAVIPKSAPNSRLAQKFLEYLEGEAQQKQIQDAGYYPGVHPTGHK
ncbi:molybdate ABC transporter substrate-binding protein [Sansalvadorimonas verongulae]|uniref:molybdate ABC transporter substrate-binding protein n=1 Tax=Sansalvadorimonas verongulae TaxID=2172824 RepID=UPI0012BC4263|nr:molybdate ABC transporter substrate-binding protein [Sansalvadorimonas verongulae]MTI15430.1 molybdate ABC transporter substrate-binding protein [Sansalvadorimonas verongulae]